MGLIPYSFVPFISYSTPYIGHLYVCIIGSDSCIILHFVIYLFSISLNYMFPSFVSFKNIKSPSNTFLRKKKKEEIRIISKPTTQSLLAL